MISNVAKTGVVILLILFSNYLGVQAQSLIVNEDYAFNRGDIEKTSSTDVGEHVFLNGRYEVLSFVVKNTTNRNLDVKIKTNIKPNWNVEFRELLGLGTWYSKGKQQVLDPAILLTKQGDQFVSSIDGNQVKKFVIILKIPDNENVSKSILNLDVFASDQSKYTQKFAYSTIGAGQPSNNQFTHIVFTNVYNNVNFPAMMDNLAKNYVNLLEFPVFPDVIFDAKGQVQSIKWAGIDRYLNVIKRYPAIKLLVYWQPYYKKFKNSDNQVISYLSPEWFTAFNSVLSAFINHAAEIGFPKEKLNLMIMDEVHSKNLTDQVDQSVQECLLVAKSVKANFPDLMQFNTFSNNTQSKDVKALVNYSGTFIQHWPLPSVSTSLGRRLNPALEFNSKTQPLFNSFKNTGRNVLNYHISKGKSDNIAIDELLFPVISILSGNKGVGWWAYNSFSGSSWDDLDGKNLDYSFIYKGDDVKATQITKNTMSEDIVPSIRWLAARDGIQNAILLQKLKNSSGKLNTDQRKELNAIISNYRSLVDDDNNPISKSSISVLKINNSLSRRLSLLWGDFNK